MPSPPSFPVGSFVECTGGDEPEVQVWRGHPGLVVDTPPFDPEEAMVSLVGGPSIGVLVSRLRAIDAAMYRERGERIIAGKHPVEDRIVGDPITADGSHWP